LSKKYKQRTPNNVLAGDEAPVPAVRAVIAIVAHAEVIVFGDDKVFSLLVCPDQGRPFRRYSRGLIEGNVRKVVGEVARVS
jgi:hypothetical protein